nr:MAG TPA: hypothetical protein [Caudoviricetes sp.]
MCDSFAHKLLFILLFRPVIVAPCYRCIRLQYLSVIVTDLTVCTLLFISVIVTPVTIIIDIITLRIITC